MPTIGRPIEFWFDFGSPSAYFAAQSVETIAYHNGREVLWRPFMLEAALKAAGMAPLGGMPLYQRDYARHDWARLARSLDVPFRLSARHPIVAVAASRMFYWIETRSRALAVDFAHLAFTAYFARGVDTGMIANAAALGDELGLDPGELAVAAGLPEMKQKLKVATEEAVARGVFGSPFFIVDGEPFWGAERLPVMAEWLRRSGW